MGLDAPGSHSTQAIFFDYDRDNDLDMFLLNHATMFYAPFSNTKKLRTLRHPYFSNYLFRNNSGQGNFHFTDVSEEAGIKGGGNNFGLGVAVSDIDNDGWPDLYTTNDYEEQDFLYLNNQDGTFRDVTKQALQHISKFGMGCDIADYNNDGWMDILVLDMLPEDNQRQKLLQGPDDYNKYTLLIDSGYFHQNMRNTLQLNNGLDNNGVPRFSEIGQLAGISNTDWSWAPLMADFDNDGWKDLFIANGFLRDYTNMDFHRYTVAEYQKKYGDKVLLADLVKELPQVQISNYVFRNNGDLTFKDATQAWGLFKPIITNGAAYADLDNDGDLDLILNNMNEKASIYKNNSEVLSNNFISIRLQCRSLNQNAIGAKVTVETISGRKQFYEVMPSRGFQSSVDPVLHIGLGKEKKIKQVTVQWPDGKVTRHTQIKINNLNVLQLESGTPVQSQEEMPFTAAPLFTDITEVSGIDFLHQENDFVDFKHEYLLPWKLSRQGPQLSKADVNGDGLEDLFIGAPIGQIAALYLQTTDGKFRRSASQPWEKDSLCEDIQSSFLDVDNDGDLDLYVVSGGNETHASTVEMQDRMYLNDGKGNFTKLNDGLPKMITSKSCVAVADFNKDGKPDIFVGGRVVPGNFGASPESYLLRNESKDGNVKLVNVTASAAKPLQKAGMITDAAWVDINKDTWPDLIVVGEWMPVRIFINYEGVLKEETTRYGLSDTGGLWTKIFPFDYDNDGDVDFVLGNLAPNTQFKASKDRPMEIYTKDFDNNGVADPIITYFNKGSSYPYASRDELLEQMPSLKSKFTSYATYANATLEDILSSDQLEDVDSQKVHMLENSVLTNNGEEKFNISSLPRQAQFSAIFGMVPEDNNQDGKYDLLLAGNFYPFRVQLGRQDASIGLLLKWDNKENNFIPIPYQESGLMIPGDVRDMLSISTKSGNRLLIIAKNNDHVQVLREKNKR
ncbi:MAG: VCBS repeat-containing protein [Anditalea sp.]